MPDHPVLRTTRVIRRVPMFRAHSRVSGGNRPLLCITCCPHIASNIEQAKSAKLKQKQNNILKIYKKRGGEQLLQNVYAMTGRVFDTGKAKISTFTRVMGCILNTRLFCNEI